MGVKWEGLEIMDNSLHTHVFPPIQNKETTFKLWSSKPTSYSEEAYR